MKTKKIKTIVIDIYEDGSTDIKEINYADSKVLTNGEANSDNLIIESTRPTQSWINYGLITYSRNSKLFEELVNRDDDKIIISINNKEFIGKIDKKQARIYSLQTLMKFLNNKNYNIIDAKFVELIYDKTSNILELNLIN